jgi:hypothetical protein
LAKKFGLNRRTPAESPTAKRLKQLAQTEARKKSIMSTIKLPHWALVGLSLTAAILSWLVAHNASGDFVLPATILGIIPIAQMVIGMLSPSVVTSTNVLAAKRAGAAVTVACLMFVGGRFLPACSGAQQSQEVTLGVDTLVCVLNHDTDPPPTIALECGISDLTQIATILNAHKAAMIRDLALDGGVTK